MFVNSARSTHCRVCNARILVPFDFFYDELDVDWVRRAKRILEAHTVSSHPDRLPYPPSNWITEPPGASAST